LSGQLLSGAKQAVQLVTEQIRWPISAMVDRKRGHQSYAKMDSVYPRYNRFAWVSSAYRINFPHSLTNFKTTRQAIGPGPSAPPPLCPSFILWRGHGRHGRPKLAPFIYLFVSTSVHCHAAKSVSYMAHTSNDLARFPPFLPSLSDPFPSRISAAISRQTSFVISFFCSLDSFLPFLRSENLCKRTFSFSFAGHWIRRGIRFGFGPAAVMMT